MKPAAWLPARATWKRCLGRRRYFPNLINPANQALRAREEREAINAPIQGTAADIVNSP